MRKLIKRLLDPFLKLGAKKAFSKPRPFKYDGIEVMVMPEVFPPHYTLSTKILLQYLKPLKLENKTVLELGCGSGIISLFAASKKAIVTASDINNIALTALKQATVKNNLDVEIIKSDLFQNLTSQGFDYVIINPPYYPKNPTNIKENAWFCGEDFEYFRNLFIQLQNRSDDCILMILSQDCNISKITDIASKQGFKLEIELERTMFTERNYIYKVSSKN
ncbi:methyltransferase [uncultured Winogradskyella sp.]|uniref:methyltransferase n=1 Tax=uncultured Winogradskyella sp. TaxID=395353 RepID=UPI0026215FA6|nr:methyltransferase [uncultured Winogradskyella sp.]